MSDSILSSARSIIVFIAQLLLTVAFGILLWAMWGLYKEEKLTNLFEKEGRLVVVKAEEVDATKRLWTDYLGNVKYVSFHYQGKQYTTRFVQDTLFVGEGTSVPLLFRPASDAFRQPGKQFKMKINNYTSRLIKWSSVSLFSTENRWLLLCMMIFVVFFLFLTGLLSQIPGFLFMKKIGSLFFTVLVLAGAVYLTYDAYVYYRYYQHIKATGEKLQVTVVDKSHTRSIRNDDYFGDDYSAVVNFKNAQREIPIEQEDYAHASKGSQLTVYYAASVDDMMAFDYSMNIINFIFPLLVWGIIIFIFFNNRSKR